LHQQLDFMTRMVNSFVETITSLSFASLRLPLFSR
jgi:hypothetical protein